MSKLIVEVHNYTDKLIWLGSMASGRAELGRQTPLGKGRHPLNWNIPDNSDSSKYFDTNHLSIGIYDPITKEQSSFSVWGDDWKNYDIYFCKGTDWKNTTRPMRGGDHGKDGTKVILHITERPDESKLPDIVKLPGDFGRYELTVVAVTDEQLKKNLSKAFQAFRTHPAINLIPGKKYTNEELAALMTHPAFRPVIDAADEGQWKTVGLIFGVEGGLAVGGQAYIGLLLGIQNRMLRASATAAISLGLDIGVDAFIGVYLSMADPPSVAGLEFFAQLGAGDGPGICLVGGISLGGTRSFSILVTAGVDVYMGIGAGYTRVADH